MKVNDGFTIQPAIHHSTSDLDSLMLVYTPSIGYFAVSVYLMLSSLSHTQNLFQPVRKILDLMNCSLDDLETALKRCEQFQLIDTYVATKQNQDFYVFELHTPLSLQQYMDHDVFGRYLVRVLDASYHQQLKEILFKNHQQLKEYNNISQEFDANLLPHWDQNLENLYQFQPNNHVELPDSLQFNTNLFIKSVSTLLFPTAARSKENVKAIEHLGSLYGIDVVTMKRFVGKCTKPNSDYLDVAKLESLVLGFVNEHKTSTQSVYEEDSYRFFSSKQKGKPVGLRDKKVIAFLYEHYTFDQEVQNRLIEYVLSRFNGSFTKSLVQQIADSWVRANILTAADAKAHLSQQKATTITQDVPDYMEPKNKKTATPSDEKQRKELLNKLRKGE